MCVCRDHFVNASHVVLWRHLCSGLFLTRLYRFQIQQRRYWDHLIQRHEEEPYKNVQCKRKLAPKPLNHPPSLSLFFFHRPALSVSHPCWDSHPGALLRPRCHTESNQSRSLLLRQTADLREFSNPLKPESRNMGWTKTKGGVSLRGRWKHFRTEPHCFSLASWWADFDEQRAGKRRKRRKRRRSPEGEVTGKKRGHLPGARASPVHTKDMRWSLRGKSENNPAIKFLRR